MKKKQVVIHNCEDCPFYDDYYWNYRQTCTLLRRITPRNGNIPDDCPLVDADEKEEEN